MFRKLFGNRRRKEFNYSPVELTGKLELLEDVISDVGYWNWWTADFPNHIMLEFGGTQIWSSPQGPGLPPSGKIGITFLQPYSVSFITRNWLDREIPENWIELLHNDQLELPEIEKGNFTFTDLNLIERIHKDAFKCETVFGSQPNSDLFNKSEFKFAFWAFSFGCIITSQSLNIVSHDGELSLDDIHQRNLKWWEYWEEYWAKRDSNSPLPKDYACEVTIPAGTKITIRE